MKPGDLVGLHSSSQQENTIGILVSMQRRFVLDDPDSLTYECCYVHIATGRMCSAPKSSWIVLMEAEK